MRNAGFMAAVALAAVGAGSLAAQESGSPSRGQGQPSGSNRGVDQQPSGSQTVTVTGCVQRNADAGATSSTARFTLMASAVGGQRSGTPGSAGSTEATRGGSAGTTQGGGSAPAGVAQGAGGATNQSQSGTSASSPINRPMTYTLEGGDVAKHVGHQVEVTGTVASAATSGSTTNSGVSAGNQSAVGTTGDSARSGQTLRVTSIRMLSESCSR